MEDKNLQEVTFFFDDSGVFHKNERSGYFVYAGYVFTNRSTLDAAKRKYINANKALKKALGRNDELKAAGLSAKHKRSLFNAVKEYDSVSVTVNLSHIYDHILSKKHSICRYKDYALKRCIKGKMKALIESGVISKTEDITLSIFVDEQLTATNGYYNLRDSIIEELQFGISNFDYGIRHQNLFDSNVYVKLLYCDSKTNYMIQASDILANRIWASYITKNRNLRSIDNHIALTLP